MDFSSNLPWSEIKIDCPCSVWEKKTMKAMCSVANVTRTGRRAFSAAAKEVKFGDEGRAAMARGVNILARAVATTLGPKGRTVIIEQSYGAPKITKDGVTVAKSISLADKYENLGARLVQDVASKTNETAGDGTTTATILARAIFVEGLKCIASGVNAAELRQGISQAVQAAVDYLQAQSTKITTSAQITQVATISANGDRHIGAMIADAMARVGAEGVITVQEGKTVSDELVVTEGMKFERGFISPYFINDTRKQETHFEEALVLLSERKITLVADILPALELAARDRRPLLVVAEDVDGEALAALVLNKLRGQIAVCAVKAPGFGDNRRAMLEDMAVLTGGQVFNDTVGVKLSEPSLAHFGRVKSVTIGKDDTVLLNGQGVPETIHARAEQLRAEIAATQSDYEREKLQERLARLSGGVAVIRVGGVSEVEVGERKDRFVDALNATRAAVAEGVIPGGGAALIKAVPRLQALAREESNNDRRLGIRIVAEAIQAPLRTIVDNSGESGAVVAGEVLKRCDVFSAGYNAATGQYVDMMEAGIIDPLKVVRTGLVDAAGVASLLVTTEAMVVDVPKASEREGNANAGAGAMGAMGMDY
jgi:chaperonin GroEL